MKSFFTFLFLSFIISSVSIGQDGKLETTFGTNGTKLISSGTGNAEILGILKDGNSLIGVGFSRVGNFDKIAMVKMDLNGNMDATFGQNGLLTFPFGSGHARASSIIQQPDGKYLVAGWARYVNKDEYVIIRLLQNGSLDSSFGTNGLAKGVFSNSSFAEDEIAQIALLSDNKIVIAGRSYNGQNDDGFVACFNTDGSLNKNFGTDGFLIIEFDVIPPSESVRAFAIDKSDNIYLGGDVATGFNTEDAFFIMKLNKDGVKDTSFGTNGVVTKVLSANIVAGLNTMEIDAKGRILTGGGAFDTDELDNNYFLTRYNPNGTPDMSFGQNGQVILARSANESISDLIVFPSGLIIAAGSTGGFPSSFAMVRLFENGSQDMSFGTNGWSIEKITNDFNSIKSVVYSDGFIYAGGTSRVDPEWRMAFAKYKNKTTSSTYDDLSNLFSSFNLYPNPTANEINLSFDINAEMSISISLNDIMGRTVQDFSLNQTKFNGNNNLNLQLLPSLLDGMYILNIHTSKGLFTRKIYVISEN